MLTTRPARDGGSMSVEVVLLMPLLVMFLLVVVAMGRAVAIRGQMEAATRDAVRAASYERSEQDALDAAQATADADLAGRDCTDVDLRWGAAGQVIELTLRCRVPWSDMGLIGLPGHLTLESSSQAPLDQFRRSR